MKKYFEVVAKCGHVGRGYYYEGHFFVAAQCASNAAQAIRNVPRVKHNHSDAILWTKEISHEEYVCGCKARENNPYFNATNPREQAAVWYMIEQDVYPETKRQIAYRERHTKHEERDMSESRYGYRKYYKYMKNKLKNSYNYNDYDEAA